MYSKRLSRGQHQYDAAADLMH